jgi:N-acyl-D-aspartate/D-glutamate deacylase
MTLLVRNAKIVGGAREFPDPMDVFVANGRISAIGKFSDKAADETFDAQGAWLSPGFIDLDAASDHYFTLFDDRGQEDFLRQGVTTIMGGMGGSSLAPLPYGTLESLQKWGDPRMINVDWHTVGEFLAALDERPLGVNFGTLVGHATVRRALVGEALRALTHNELRVFARTLKEALAQGAFGISTDLSSVHTRNVSYDELSTLLETVERAGGIHAAGLRVTEGEGMEDAVEEIAHLLEDTGVPTFIAHFMPFDGSEDAYRKALAHINRFSGRAPLRFSAHPFGQSLAPLYTFLPSWAQNGGMAVMVNNIKDEWFRTRVRKDLPAVDEDTFIIAHAPGNEFLVGKTLHDIRTMHELPDARDALLVLMTTTDLRCSVLVRNINTGIVRKALASPQSFVGTHSPSWGPVKKSSWIKPEAATSAYTTFLGLAAHGDLSPLGLAGAVAKLTAEPASFLGLKDRGTIKEGLIADLTCFRTGNDGTAAEIRCTVVNGVIAVENGVFKGRFPGKVLRHL